MEFYTIIRKGTDKNPEFMVHTRDYETGEIILDIEDDNLPVFQAWPEAISNEELEKFGCKIVKCKVEIIGDYDK